MQVQKLTLKNDLVITVEAGELNAIVVEGQLFIPLLQGLTIGEASEAPKAAAEVPAATGKQPVAKKTAPAKAAVVADDTVKPAAEPAPKQEAPTVVEQTDEVEENPLFFGQKELEPTTLQVGQKVAVFLSGEGMENKLWGADVVYPHVGQETEIFVKFHEDGMEDYLREGDRVFEFSLKF